MIEQVIKIIGTRKQMVWKVITLNRNALRKWSAFFYRKTVAEIQKDQSHWV